MRDDDGSTRFSPPKAQAIDDDKYLEIPLSDFSSVDDVDEARLARLPHNDLGNAHRFLGRHFSDVIHVAGFGWMVWTGKVWSREEAVQSVPLLAHATVKAMRGESKILDGVVGKADLAAAHRKWARQSGDSRRMSNMINEAEYCVARGLEELDVEPMIFNVANGTLDLRTGKLHPHRREDLLTKISPVEWDQAADCPIFREFLDEITPDRAVQEFLQRFFGYALTGDASEQVVACFCGAGSNGKSTLVETMAWILGEYARTLPIQSLLHNGFGRGSDASPDMARLPGARLVATAEPDMGDRFSESMLKTLTGGERMAARRLHQDFFEFIPTFKLVISFNNKPKIRGQDKGIWRRILLVPFTVEIPEAARDRRLLEKLRGEASGILVWLAAGARDWLEGGLRPPDAVRAASDDYRRESDPLAQFLEDCTRQGEILRTRSNDLYQAYIAWCRANGVSHPVTHQSFGRMLGERGFEREKVGVMFYRGLELIEPDMKDAPDQAGDQI